MRSLAKRLAGVIQLLAASVVLACGSDPVGPTVSGPEGEEPAARPGQALVYPDGRSVQR